MEFLQNLDINILDFIQNNMKNPIIDNIMVLITSLGNVGLLWIAISLYLIFINKDKKTGYRMLFSLLLCFIIGNLFLKNLVARTRPFDINTNMQILINRPLDYSFPSGHTMTSFAAAIVLFHKNKKFGLIAIILASLIAFSRLYLYVHYPTDVLFGLLIGIAIGEITIYVANRLKNKGCKS